MAIKAETSFSLKDQLFNAETVALLAANLGKVDKSFKSAKFIKAVLAPFPELELKARINWIVETLESFLPSDFPSAVKILLDALPPELDPTLSDDDFGHFIWIVPGEYVAKHGCNKKHLSLSLEFLKQATKRFSSEGAIRPFLREFPQQSMAAIHTWSTHDNYHVRRLASEGIRPNLPWAARANVPVEDIIEVLNKLYSDATRYVTRSVANNLNDITKTHPHLVVDTLNKWHKDNGIQGKEPNKTNKELAWLSKHALRTLLKEDHPQALELLGFTTKPAFQIKNLDVTNKVTLGESFVWSCDLVSQAQQQLKITLKIYFLKANGSHSAKVFAVKEGQFKKGDELHIHKKQLFKPLTTRVLYPGLHSAELIINGVSKQKCDFELTTAE